MGKCFNCGNWAEDDPSHMRYKVYKSTVLTTSLICEYCFHNYTSVELDEIFKEKVLDNNITQPSHYTWIPDIECLDVAKHFNFCLGNVIKYVWRAGKKESSTALEDLKKAREYLNKEIGRLENL